MHAGKDFSRDETSDACAVPAKIVQNKMHENVEPSALNLKTYF